MKTTLVFLLVVAAASLAFIDSAPQMGDMSNMTMPNMAHSMMEFLQAFKHIAPCGDAAISMPPHDPLRLSTISLDIDHELLVLKGSIENTVLTGLTDFVVIELGTNESKHRTTFDILFKDLQLLGDYNLYINADMAGYKFDVTLKGLMNLQVLGLRLRSGNTMGMNAVGGVEMSDVIFDIQVGDVRSYNLDTQWSVAFNNFLNKYIEDASLLWLQTNRRPINEALSQWGGEKINEALYNITGMEFMMGMVNLTKNWEAMKCN